MVVGGALETQTHLASTSSCTQALGQVKCGFLIYKLGVNTSYVLHQVMRIQWPIKHLKNACHIYGVNKCSILSSPRSWTKFILVTKSIPFSILEEYIWDIGAAISQKRVPGHKSNLLSSPDTQGSRFNKTPPMYLIRLSPFRGKKTEGLEMK